VLRATGHEPACDVRNARVPNRESRVPRPAAARLRRSRAVRRSDSPSPSVWRRHRQPSVGTRAPRTGTQPVRRGRPSLFGETALENLRTLDERAALRVALNLLPAVRPGNHELVVVSVALAPDFVVQPRLLPLKKPNHATVLSASALPAVARGTETSRATCDVLRATCYVRLVTCDVLRATGGLSRATCSVRRATCAGTGTAVFETEQPPATPSTVPGPFWPIFFCQMWQAGGHAVWTCDRDS
jgi:hypothetical protein